MGAVEVRAAPIVTVIVRVREHVCERGRIVFRLGERVRRTELQAAREPAFETDLEAVVHRKPGVLRQTENA